MSASKYNYLKRMGIDVWLQRDRSIAIAEDLPTSIPVSEATVLPSRNTVVVPAQNNTEIQHLDWDQLGETVAQCQACELHSSRTQTVFGVGDRQAKLLIIGEAPGFEEDKQGEPFVGKAGQLLNEMLKAIDLSREQVFIANILKCHPPNNRDPKQQEAEQCAIYLKRQIALIQPKLILAVGRIAAQRLLNTNQSLSVLRGQCHHYPNSQIPVWITYHPAYLLRKPSEKRQAWLDLIKVKCLLLGN